MGRQENAEGKFREGYNCAQSVFWSFTDKLGIERDFALKSATGFGGGMGRKQEVCGALSGGVMVLNVLYGRGEHDDKQKQEDTYSKVRLLFDKFEAKHGSVNCGRLLGGCVLLTPEGQEIFKSKNLIEKCRGYVRDVVAILDEMLDRR